jgi:hypothetical protein
MLLQHTVRIGLNINNANTSRTMVEAKSEDDRLLVTGELQDQTDPSPRLTMETPKM